MAVVGSRTSGDGEVEEIGSQTLADRILTMVAHATGHATILGIARARPDLGISRLITEAHQARLLAADGGPGSWATSDRVAAHRMLLATAGPELRLRIQQRLLAPILDYDERHGTDLLDTLRSYFATDCSWKATADLLHLHVNTLRYRVEKVESLIQRDLGRTDDRLDLLLALRFLGVRPAEPTHLT